MTVVSQVADAPTSVLDDLNVEAAEAKRANNAALAQLLKPVRWRLRVGRILAALSGIIAVAPYVALVRLGDILLDAYAAGQLPAGQDVRPVIFFLVGAFATRLTLYFIALGITHFADVRLGAQIRGQLIDSLSRAPLSWFSATTSGRVRKAVQDDIQTLHTLVAHAPVESTAAMVMPFAMLGYVFVIDWRLGLLALATLPIYIGAYAWMMRGMGVKTAEMEARLAQVSSRMVEFVSGITVVKAFGTVGRAHGRYIKAAEDFSTFYTNWCQPMLKGNAIASAFVSVPILLLVNLAGGSLMVQAGWVGPAEVLAAALIALVVPAAVQTMGNTAWAYELAGASAARIIALTRTGTLDQPEASEALTPRDDTVVFDNVTYSYGETLAVEGVSLTLEPGTVTALIGPSGSGKSTLATMVARFADPDVGQVRLGGVDLRDISSAELYRRVAFVLQDPQLLRISIRDNITLARPAASDEQVRKAAADAQILTEIEALDKGFDTVIGIDTQLSGGQQQRIAIARALLADAPVLILDEATAFTDPESETQIQEALSRLAEGRTVLVIAHRIGSIAGADQIVVLERGRVVARGNHAELIHEPHYAALWRGVGADPEFEEN